jgi:hypothetical protein
MLIELFLAARLNSAADSLKKNEPMSMLDEQQSLVPTAEDPSRLKRISPNFRAQEAVKPDPYYRAKYAAGGGLMDLRPQTNFANPASYEDIVSKNVKPAWYNSYKIHEMEDQIRKLIITMFKNKPETNLWGFKEIRYDNKKINLIKFFKKLFPQTKVIIQIRENIQAQSQSSWFKKDKNAIPFLKKTSNELIEFYSQNKEWCYLTSFEKMFQINNLKNLFQFIGCGENFKESEIKEILQKNLKD